MTTFASSNILRFMSDVLCLLLPFCVCTVTVGSIGGDWVLITLSCLQAAAPQFKSNSTNGFDSKSDSTEVAPKRERRGLAGLIVAIVVVIIVELAVAGIEYGISTSCVAGDTTMRKLDEETKTETSTAVRDLNRGDVVLGAAGGDLTPTYCKVETVGFFGNGSVYGNYTDHHFMLDNSTKEVHAHGTLLPYCRAVCFVGFSDYYPSFGAFSMVTPISPRVSSNCTVARYCVVYNHEATHLRSHSVSASRATRGSV